MLKEVTLYTDGACSGNPGSGGWAAILQYKGRLREFSGGAAKTTNNRMELTAVIEGLKALKERCNVTVYTDSKYVADAIEKGWARSWQRNGWKNASKKPALNTDLFEALLTLTDQQDVRFVWVKGHSGHPMNERCDALAVNMAKRFTSEPGTGDSYET